MSIPVDFEYERIALAAQECANAVCGVPAEPYDDEEVKGFTELTQTIWNSSTVGSVDVRQSAVVLDLAPERAWHECTDVERRWWIAFKDAILAMRGSMAAPTQDHAVILPARQKVRARDMIFEQLDGSGERTGHEDGGGQTTAGVIVTRPPLARVAEDLPQGAMGGQGIDDDEERRVAMSMSAEEIAQLPGDQRARIAAMRGFPSITASPPPRVTTRPPDTPMQTQVAVIRAQLTAEDGKQVPIEGKAVISRPIVPGKGKHSGRKGR